MMPFLIVKKQQPCAIIHVRCSLSKNIPGFLFKSLRVSIADRFVFRPPSRAKRIPFCVGKCGRMSQPASLDALDRTVVLIARRSMAPETRDENPQQQSENQSLG